MIVGLGLMHLHGCDRLKNYTDVEHVQRAKAFQDQGNLRTAVIELKNALQQNPNNSEARWLLGDIYVGLDEGKDAEKELKRANDLGINPEQTKVSLGKALLLQGEFKRVLNEIKTEQNASPSNASKVMAIRGEAQLGLGRIDEARNSFEQALTIQPDMAEALLGKARITAAVDKNLDGAVAMVDMALAKAPKNLAGLMLKGDLQRLAKNEGAALAVYKKALEYYPDDMTARLNVASGEIAAAKYDEAAKHIEGMRKRVPNHPLINYLQALLDFRQGKNAAALEAVQKVLAVEPDHQPSLLLAGAVQDALGSYGQAERALRTYLEKNGDNLEASKLLASVLIKAKHPERAIEVLAPVSARAPKDVQLLALTGEAYVRSGQFSKGTGYLEQAAAIDPKNAALQTALGTSRLASGDASGAMANLETAIHLDAGQTQADALLVLGHINKKEYDQAIEAAKMFAKRQPDSPVPYNLLGAAYLGKNDSANARTSFERALSLKADYFPAAVNLAQMDLQAKQPAAARKRFENVLAKDDKNLPAMLALGQMEAQAGNTKESIVWLERARKDNPTAVQPRLLLASYYLTSGMDVPKALIAAHEASTLEPTQPEVLEMLGQAQLASGDSSNALATFSMLTRVAPQSALAHYRLAVAQVTAGNSAAAVTSLKKALELKPESIEATSLLAAVESRSGRTAEAVRLAQQLQKQQPKLSVGYALEGDILLQQKKYKEAAKTYGTAYELGKSGLLATAIDTAIAQGNPAGNTHERLQEWLKENPRDVGARLYLADASLQSGRDAEAIQQYEAILQFDDKNPLALNNLASLMQKQKNPRASEYAERAYALHPDNPSIIDTLGWILSERGESSRAVVLLRKAAELAPKDTTIQYHLAASLVKSGDKGAARKELEQLLAKDRQFSQREDAKALLKGL